MPLLIKPVFHRRFDRIVEPSDFTLLFLKNQPVKKSQHPSTSRILYLEMVVVPMSFCLLSTQSFFLNCDMALNIPESLMNLEANGGIYAVWMLLQHLYIDADIEQLIEVCGYDAENGTTTIGLAVGLKKFGFNVQFYTDQDPDIQEQEKLSYAEAEQLKLPVLPAINYQQIQQAFEQNKFVIVYYDTLEEVGNHSLVYSIDEQEICFFDSFDAMPASVFEQLHQAEGICRQVILIDDSNARTDTEK